MRMMECLTITWDVFEFQLILVFAPLNGGLTITWDVFEFFPLLIVIPSLLV